LGYLGELGGEILSVSQFLGGVPRWNSVLSAVTVLSPSGFRITQRPDHRITSLRSPSPFPHPPQVTTVPLHDPMVTSNFIAYEVLLW
jgi:hypothetical protein